MIPAEGGCISPKGRVADYVIDHATGCWIWQKRTLRGYGLSSFDALGFRTQYAHRVYYFVANGIAELDSKIDIHHRCHNPTCINPDHLEPIYHRTHVADHRRGDSVLTAEDVQAIRDASLERGVTVAQLAERFGVTKGCVDNLIRGRRWIKDNVKVKPRLVCLWERCGREFEGRRHAKYCSKECRWKANTQQQTINARLAREALQKENSDG